MSSKRRDFRQELTHRVIEAIENGDGPPPWQICWWRYRPFNPVSRRVYRGGNSLSMLIAYKLRGYKDPRWMTFRQIQQVGMSLRAGSKSVSIEFWYFDGKKAKKDNSYLVPNFGDSNEIVPTLHEPRGIGEKRPPLARIYHVFNGDDIIGLPPLKEAASKWSENDLAERLLKVSGAELIQDPMTPTPRYNLGRHVIIMPLKGQTNEAKYYYSDMLHELAHWAAFETGISRIITRSDKKEYARYELSAELSSCIMRSMMGIDEQVERTASYLRGYLQYLKNDKHEIFRAARDAEVIVDYLLDKDSELRAEIEAGIRINFLSPDSEPAAHNWKNENAKPSVGDDARALTNQFVVDMTSINGIELEHEKEWQDKVAAHVDEWLGKNSLSAAYLNANEDALRSLWTSILQTCAVPRMESLLIECEDVCQRIIKIAAEKEFPTDDIRQLVSDLRRDYYGSMIALVRDGSASQAGLVRINRAVLDPVMGRYCVTEESIALALQRQQSKVLHDHPYKYRENSVAEIRV